MAAALVVLACAAAPARADTKVVTFDDQPPGTEITDQYRASHGVYWAEADPGFEPLIKSAMAQARSGGQVAGIANCAGAGDCEFFNPATFARLDNSARAVSVYVGYLGSGSDTAGLTLRARNSAGTVIDTAGPVTVTRGAPFTQKLEVRVDDPAIASFELRADSGFDQNKDLAMDDLAIEYPDAPPPPDFSFAGGTAPENVRQGSSVEVPIDVNRINGSNGDVTMSVEGLPAGMSASFAPNPVPGTESRTVMTLRADDLAPPSDPYTDITITGTPAPGAGSAPRSFTKPVRVVKNCDRLIRFDYVDARTRDCLVKVGTEYHATNTEVRLNGLVIKPADDSRPTLVIDPEKKFVKGKEPTMPFTVSVDSDPDIPIYAGPVLNWSFEGSGSGPRKVIGLNANVASFLKSLPIRSMEVWFLKDGRADVKPTIKLGFWPFNYFGAVTTATTFTTSNDREPDFSGLELKLDKVNALALELRDVSLKWREGGTWSGAAKLVLKFSKPYTIGAGLGIKNGSFDFARGSVGGLNYPIGSGIYLQSIGVEVRASPRSIEGNIGLSAGPSVRGVKAVTFGGGVKATLADPFVIEVNGNAKVADRYQIGKAFLRYSSTGLFEFGGEIDVDIWRLDLEGEIEGWVDGLEAFNVEGRIEACLDVWGPNPCGGAKAIFSSRGVAGCIGAYGYYVGAGATWDLDFDAFTGCDLKAYREQKPKSLRSAAVQSRTTLPRGLRSAAWELTGQGGPPGVTVIGPGGVAVSANRDTPVVQQGPVLIQLREDGTTFVLVNRPAAGQWTISDDDTVPITRVREARGIPDPSVKAVVRGRGHRRVLSWSVRPIAGQRVRFAEVGANVRNAIATTGARRGSVRFRPAEGPAGRRRIVALVEQDGMPRTTLNVGSYRAPATRKPGRPRSLRIVRRGSRLVMSWRPNPAGFRHAVHITLGDGRSLVREVPARRRSLTLKGVSSKVGAKVKVIGLTPANAKGPSARASIKPRR